MAYNKRTHMRFFSFEPVLYVNISSYPISSPTTCLIDLDVLYIFSLRWSYAIIYSIIRLRFNLWLSMNE